MATGKKQLRFLLLIFFTVNIEMGCTDRRVVSPIPPLRPQQLPAETMEARAEIQFEGGETNFLTMQEHNGAIDTTGFPFGMASIDYASDPENPHPAFFLKDQIDTALQGAWAVDWYADGSILHVGNNLFTSGSDGVTAFDVSAPHTPVEKRRYPPLQNGQPVRDEAFIYRAMAAHPTIPGLVFGFTEQTFVYRIQQNGPQLNLVGKSAYGPYNQPVCCVQGAAFFRGVLFVAFRSALYAYQIGSNGQFVGSRRFPNLHAVNVAASANHLYVQVGAPYSYGTSSTEAPLSEGIYVFDETGQTIAYLNVNPIVFAPAASDSHLFTNEDEQSMKVYRQLWTNRFSAH